MQRMNVLSESTRNARTLRDVKVTKGAAREQGDVPVLAEFKSIGVSRFELKCAPIQTSTSHPMPYPTAVKLLMYRRRYVRFLNSKLLQ